MNTSHGEPTNAVYGVSALLLKLLREQRPDGLCFALDAPVRTFRHEAFEGYKATRKRMPSALSEQLGRLDELLEAIDVPRFCVPGFEADDVIATLSVKVASETRTALVVSGDRDLLQLVDSNTRVLFVGARGKQPQLYDRQAVEQRFKIPAERLPSFTALVGDTSDNLPGVPGIGPGTASKLLQEYADVSALLANVERVTPARARAALVEHADQIREVERLARLSKSVPLDEGPVWSPLRASAVENLQRLFEELEFKSLFERLAKLETVER
jgi:DNA polymerase-1